MVLVKNRTRAKDGISNLYTDWEQHLSAILGQKWRDRSPVRLSILRKCERFENLIDNRSADPVAVQQECAFERKCKFGWVEFRILNGVV